MRIVSLLPSATELVAELGLRSSLVGVSHECDTPADVAGLPRLTSSILGHDLSQAEIDAAVSRAVREAGRRERSGEPRGGGRGGPGHRGGGLLRL